MDVDEPCAVVPLSWAGDPSAAFAPVAGEPAFVGVLRSLLGPVAPKRLVVAVPSLLFDEARARLRSADLTSVAVVPAAARRQAIGAGLEHVGVESNSSVPVLIGDHRHPLSTSAVARRVVARLREGYRVAVPTLPVTDTVKTVDDLGSVLRTVDRSALRTVQYPRGFIASTLWELLSIAAPESADDEFGIALHAGLAIGTVEGDPNAFQVDLPRDAQLLAAITGCRSA